MPDEVPDAVTAIDAERRSDTELGAPWSDEATESSFLAGARERGEAVVVAPPQEENFEATEAKALPPLDDLVQRIPEEVRDVLEDLFRARFLTVKRVPKKAFKK